MIFNKVLYRPNLVVLLTNLVFLLLAIFLVGFFIFPDAPEHNKFFYRVVMVPVLLVLFAGRFSLPREGLLASMAFLTYMAISGLWSEGVQFSSYMQMLRSVLGLASFILIMVEFARRQPEWFDRTLQLLCLLAAAMAVISLISFYSEHPFPVARVESVGRSGSINRGAALYGIFAVIGACYGLRFARWKGYLFGAASAVLIAMVVLSQTRTAIVAVSVSLGILFFRETRRVVVLLIATAFLLVAIFLLTYPEMLHLIGRSIPFRPAIWAQAMDQFLAAPWFGWGMLVNTAVTVIVGPDGQVVNFNHVHNGYLATMRDGGLVGLLLLLLILWRAGVTAMAVLRRNGDARLIALFVYAAIVIFPIQDRLITAPREHWLYFWLPVILIAVYGKYLSWTANGKIEGSRQRAAVGSN